MKQFWNTRSITTETDRESPSVNTTIRVQLSERTTIGIVLAIAIIQGLLFLFLLPPWQHYDEPTHFEYAAFIADRGRLPQPGDVDRPLRREIAASMLAHDFYEGLSNPDLWTDAGEIWIGISELGHPPGYYLFLSAPLRLFQHLDVTSRLYIARFVSFLLFLLTVVAATGLMRDLTSTGHILRWVVPLSIVLLAPFVDLMTAVNNDVGATFVVTLFLWVAVRSICYGLSPIRFITLIGLGVLSIAIKNTAAITLLLIPVIVLLRWQHRRQWRWRWAVAALAGLAVVGTLLLFQWGDAAYWYWFRWGEGEYQNTPTRIASEQAPDGEHAFRVSISPQEPRRMFFTPIPRNTAASLAGSTVTLGSWLWADKPASVAGVGLRWGEHNTRALHDVVRPVTVTTQPAFYAWSFDVPENAETLLVTVFARRADAATDPLTLFLDGVVLVEGDYAPHEPVLTTVDSGTLNMWAEGNQDNYIRNFSAEASWPRLRPNVEERLDAIVRRPTAHLLLSVVDFSRVGRFLVTSTLPYLLQTLFARFAWAHVTSATFVWVPLTLYSIVAVAIAGCLRWIVESKQQTTQYASVVFLGVAGTLLWGSAVVWPLAYLWFAKIILPAARYTFPVIVPTMLALAGGWHALWPARYRVQGSLIFVGILFLLNVAGIIAIYSHYFPY